MGLTKPRAYQIFDIDYKQAVRVITLTNITLSGGAPSTVDGVSLTTGDRILVAGQSTGSQNGLYQVSILGTGANGTWIRSVDTNESGELNAGTIVMVTEGTTYKDTQWKLTTNDPIVIGTTALVFEQNSAFAFGNIYANSTAVLADVVGDTVTFTPANNMVILANATTDTITFEVSQSPSFTGNFQVSGTVGSNLIPTANIVYNLGNTTNRWNDLWLSNSTIYLGNAQISANATSLILTNPEGAQTVLSGPVANVTAANASIGNLLITGNIFDSGTSLQINTTTAANISLAPNQSIVLTATTTGANITGTLNATGNANVGNLGTSGLITATGNITGGNLVTSGLVSAGTTIDATGNISGGNLTTTGQIVSSGNITGNYLLANITFASGYNTTRLFNGTSEANIGASGGNANITIGGVSNVAVFSTVGANITGTLGVTGNITGGNITAAGQGLFRSNIKFGQDSITANGGVLSHGTDNFGFTSEFNNAVFLRNEQTTTEQTLYLGDTGFGNTRTVFGITTGAGNGTAVLTLTGLGNLIVSNVTPTGNVVAVGNVTGGNVTTAGIITAVGNITGGNIAGTLLTGTLTTAAQPNVTSVGTLTSLTVSGNANVGNIGGTRSVFTNVVGTLETAAQPNITSVGTLTSATVSGNVTGGNLTTTGLTSTGTLITSGNATIGGNLTVTGNLFAVNVTNLNVQDPIIGLGRGANNTPLTSNDGKDRGQELWYYTTSEQAAFMGYDNSEGKLIAATNVTITSDVVSVNAYGNLVVGGLEATTGGFTGNVTTGNISGTTGTFTNLGGTLTTAAQPNITSVGTLTSLSVSGNVSTGNVSGTLLTGTLTTPAQPNVTSVGSLTSLTVTGNANVGNIGGTRGVFTNIVGTLETAAQPNITSVGTLTSLTVSGNASAGNLNITGGIFDTGVLNLTTTTASNIALAVNNSNIVVVTATGANITGTLNATGNANVGNIGATDGVFTSVTGTLTTAAQPNVTSVGTLTSLTASGNVTGGNLVTAGLVSATGNVNGNFFVGNGSALTGINAFGTIVVAGSDDVVADSTSDTLTLVAGTGITLTTAAGTDTITIATQGSSDSIFATGGDMGTVDEAVTAEEDLGPITEIVDTEIDMGSIVTAGIFYPDQIVFPSYTVAQLGSLSASPAGQMVYCSNESGGAVPAFSDGTNWRRVTDRAIVT